MARPIPNIDLRDLSKLPDKREEKNFLDSTVDRISRSKSSRNMILGTLSGWVTGVSMIKVGKVAAFGLGGGILLLHFASEKGYIIVNWDRVREAAAHSQAWMEKTLQFVKKNSCFSVGFIGGFFFGVAST